VLTCVFRQVFRCQGREALLRFRFFLTASSGPHRMAIKTFHTILPLKGRSSFLDSTLLPVPESPVTRHDRTASFVGSPDVASPDENKSPSLPPQSPQCLLLPLKNWFTRASAVTPLTGHYTVKGGVANSSAPPIAEGCSEDPVPIPPSKWVSSIVVSPLHGLPISASCAVDLLTHGSPKAQFSLRTPPGLSGIAAFIVV